MSLKRFALYWALSVVAVVLVGCAALVLAYQRTIYAGDERCSRPVSRLIRPATSARREMRFSRRAERSPPATLPDRVCSSRGRSSPRRVATRRTAAATRTRPASADR